MNGPVIFLEKGTKVHPSLRGNNLVTKGGLIEGSFVIPNKAAYMDDETWEKVVKVVAPGIRKMAVSNVAFVRYILFSTPLFLQILCRRSVTYQSGGPSSHMMDSSLTSMSLKALKFC